MSKSNQNTNKLKDNLDEQLINLVGLGTLNATRLEPLPDNGRAFDKSSIANGWRAMDLEKSITSLCDTTSRLRSVVTNECRYWDDMVRVRDSNWALANFNKTTAMGVRFGFVHAATQFRKVSLAKLPGRLDDGAPWLQTYGTDMNIRLRVTLFDNGQVVGRSALPPEMPDDAPLEARILEARNSVFSSELWHELNREARTLLAFNVRERGGTIVCEPPETSTKIVISVEQLGVTRSADHPLPQDAQAENILRWLQLLLRYYHRANQAHKFKRQAYRGNPISTPLTRGNPPQQQTSPYHLLRPLIFSATHESSLRDLLAFISHLVSVLRLCGIKGAGFVLKTAPQVPSRPLVRNKSALAHFATRFAIMATQNFRIDLQITPQARISIRGLGYLVPIAASQYVISLLAPAGVTSISSTSQFGTRAPSQSSDVNPLSHCFPPAKEAYPTISEVTYYICQAVVRIMVLEVQKVANECKVFSRMAASDASPKTENSWVVNFIGTGVQKPDFERELKLEVVQPNAPHRKAGVAGVGDGNGKFTNPQIDPKYHAAMVLTEYQLLVPKGSAKRWVWVPDGTTGGRTLSQTVMEAVATMAK